MCALLFRPLLLVQCLSLNFALDSHCAVSTSLTQTGVYIFLSRILVLEVQLVSHLIPSILGQKYTTQITVKKHWLF